MTRFTTLFVAASLALSAAVTASAQDTTPTLRVDQGAIMTSQGGEFANAQSGQPLVAGSRLMVTEQAAATLTYGNGCSRTYTAPGVYVVQADCAKPAATGTDWAGAAKIAGGVVVTAAILASMDKQDYVAPPVSR